ncbi:DUF2332 domain-containing protein [Ureibacillus manganicus]|uniref:DUF2332 domain-containing protein n=1 Tax=Ureibacillus manganicus DSM 26584 TaxID=1384049 RepID=A0A0A3HP65_9BACL|nr:DUF2332 domain-containing protein [Ureibacillus manganicus]KGR74321.1 hypothetical protein CD29_18810 [Ureibacillus manganicus DSM 26584]
MKQDLSSRFLQFAKECEDSSPLYEYLSTQIAQDIVLQNVAAQVPAGQPVPNMLFASVHYLLMGQDDELRSYYPTFTKTPLPVENSLLPFKQFVLKNHKLLMMLFRTRLVQTNEVRRCAYMYPIFTEIYEEQGKPLALLEIGTSAGLQLGVDQYNYLYNDEIWVRNTPNLLTITSTNLGNPLPNSIHTPPVVKTRIGADLNPINLKIGKELKWLQALIWPEHHDRRKMLVEAAQVVNNLEIQFVRGDAIEKLEDLCASISEDEQIVVFHTHVANQIPRDKREELITKLKTISKDRPLYHCYNNLFDANLHQDFLVDGIVNEKRVMEPADGHARWFSWVD